MASEIQDLIDETMQVSFSNFKINKADVEFASNGMIITDALNLVGSMTLGDDSDGINLATDDVTITVGSVSFTIPAGNFMAIGASFKFNGLVSGANVNDMAIQGVGTNNFSFKLNADGMDLSGTSNPVEIKLLIGQDVGEKSIRVEGKLKSK